MGVKIWGLLCTLGIVFCTVLDIFVGQVGDSLWMNETVVKDLDD